jgi:iron complex outermembrane receptor protein
MPFVGINNALGATYNDNIRINAFGGRYFEPAAGTTVFGGLRIRRLL